MERRPVSTQVRTVQNRHHVNTPQPKITTTGAANGRRGGLADLLDPDQDGDLDHLPDEVIAKGLKGLGDETPTTAYGLGQSKSRDAASALGASGGEAEGSGGAEGPGEGDYPPEIAFLFELAERSGEDVSDLIEDQISTIGWNARREYEIDQGSRSRWLETAERGLDLAAQDEDDEGDEKTFPFEGGSNIHYPILTVACNEFASRAYSELIKGDKVVGVKALIAPSDPATPQAAAKAAAPPAPLPAPPPGPGAAPVPPDPQAVSNAQNDAATIGLVTQAAEQADQRADLADKEKEARANRVKFYLNFLIFYRMDDWEGETDLMLHESPVTGSGFKKVHMTDQGLRSDYISATKLVVSQKTKSLERCPRITQEFEIYPWEIEERIRSGRYRNQELPYSVQDPEEPRVFLEQQRLEDLDGDGLREPYIVTIDRDTGLLFRIEPAFDDRDVILSKDGQRVIRIDRWNGIADFRFMPDPRGSFYGIGFARLLAAVTDGIDTSINQLMDAGTAQIAGGGFIGANVRLQGSGQGGNLWFRPGEFQNVNFPGADLRAAIWERTVPQPSDVTFKMLELLLQAAKEIASVKDVNMGESPSTAPVGTTLAVQSQALQVFSAIWKRYYRGFRKEFRLMYQALQRWGTDRERKEYLEMTGGDFDADFAGDGHDIQPVADPSVVTKMQKMTRVQTLTQVAESPVGQAAGMLQSGPAQEIAKEALDVMEWDRPDRFVAEVPPNQLAIDEQKAKTADMQAAAQLKMADAKTRATQAALDNAKALRETGLAALDTHDLHKEADRIRKTGQIAESPQPGEADGQTRPAA
jgi:chaperonin GroES